MKNFLHFFTSFLFAFAFLTTPNAQFALAQTAAEKKPSTAVSTASNEFPDYAIGSGSKYELEVGNEKSEVTMAVIRRSPTKIVIEILIRSLNDSEALGVKMWQQFHLKLVNGKIEIEKGIMKIPQIEKPQIFPNEYLQGYSGVKMKSFLMNSEKDVTSKKTGSESVSTAAGTFQCSRYKHSENNQTVEFWLADEAKPFGLVKMTSAGSGFGQTYNMNFKGSVTGYQSQVDESKAEPLNEFAKSFLPLLGPGLFQN